MNTENTGQLSHALIKPEHLRRKALIYVRQSTVEQVKENVGSTLFQMNQVQLARAYGWPDHLIEVLDDLGKSGSSVEGRSGWESMLSQIATIPSVLSLLPIYLACRAASTISNIFVFSLVITRCC